MFLRDHDRDKLGADAQTIIDRLCEAYCKLMYNEWDELLGEKPKGFDDKPFARKRSIVSPYMTDIARIVGDRNTTRYWWTVHLGRDEDAWAHWWKEQAGTMPAITKESGSAVSRLMEKIRSKMR